MLILILITNDPAFVRTAVDAGVGRLFVDLERKGKAERQPKGTWISDHDLEDVQAVKAAAGDVPVMVRLDPLHEGSAEQIDAAIDAGADLLMLPMFHSASEVARFCRLVAGRVGVIPLVETADALDDIARVAQVPGVTELYIGLNDLHRDMGLTFMFEPVADGLVEQAFAAVSAIAPDMPVGFGGIACVGQGDVPAEMILTEHARLGSAAVILSRTFKDQVQNEDMDLPAEIARLRAAEAACDDRTAVQVTQDQQALYAAILKKAGRES